MRILTNDSTNILGANYAHKKKEKERTKREKKRKKTRKKGEKTNEKQTTKKREKKTEIQTVDLRLTSSCKSVNEVGSFPPPTSGRVRTLSHSVCCGWTNCWRRPRPWSKASRSARRGSDRDLALSPALSEWTRHDVCVHAVQLVILVCVSVMYCLSASLQPPIGPPQMGSAH